VLLCTADFCEDLPNEDFCGAVLEFLKRLRVGWGKPFDRRHPMYSFSRPAATIQCTIRIAGINMNKISPVDVSRYSLHIHRDLSASTSIRKPGPPERIDGMTVGIVTLTDDALPPHRGEVHPDGDEILYVITGRLRVTGESEPTAAVEVGPGEACIVGKGEWHRVTLLESPTQLIHITPGPNADYRPL
jgi:mannose-6-phosphate isomerase-like protein (cupin superfamily)